MLDKILHVESIIEEASVFSFDKAADHDEVFTPFDLITEGIDHCIKDKSVEVLQSEDQSFFDASAGRGNFPIIAVKYLFKSLQRVIPNEEERLRHIIENQTFMSEFQRESANFIAYYFQFDLGLKVNLHVGDTLKMPHDFFNLSWDERRDKYPNRCILNPVPQESFVLDSDEPAIDGAGHEVQTNLFEMFS